MQSPHNHIASMTQEEQIGQLLVCGFQGTTPSPEIIDLIQNHHIGGIILFSRNVHNSQQLRTLTRSLQMIAQQSGHRYPLLIAIDQENGMVQRLGPDATTFPGNMALGAVGSEQMVYDISQATARELKAVGININLAPVVDVNNNPANPVIGTRSFGEDPQQVARLGSAFVKGHHSASIMTCLKHFPGHGDTTVDSHLSLPTIPYPLQRLEAIELIPFKSGIEAGADVVMTAHISFPALMDQPLPATLSPAILKGLLREKLGYDGVIITDCLEMKAISETIGVGPGAVKALQAGADLILVSHLYPRQQAALSTIQTALRTGELSSQSLHQALERVLQLKERFLSWDDLDNSSVAPAIVGNEAHQTLRDHAYELSATLVKNEDGLLPLRLSPDQRIAVLYPAQAAHSEVTDRNHQLASLTEYIRQRHANVIALPFEHRPSPKIILQADLIIMATMNANVDAHQAEAMRTLLRSGFPIIGIATHNPYDLLAFPQLATYLVTYEYTQPALAAAVRVIFGEIQSQGRLPVALTLP